MGLETSRPPIPAAGKRPPPVPRTPSTETVDTSDSDSSGFDLNSYWVRSWESLNGEAGAGYLLSAVIHLVLLGALAIPVIREMQKPEMVVTIITGDDMKSDQGIIGDSLNTGLDLALPEPSPGTDMGAPDLVQMSPGTLSSMDVNPENFEGLKSSPGGAAASNIGAGGGKKGTGGAGTSIRVAEPTNAIRAGSFSVWPWPIIGKDVKGKIEHAEPGSSPKVFQDYHIVIRFRVPDDRKRIPLNDFSGQVVGTDKYFQKIPQDAWYFNANGELVRARTGQSIPVFDGVAELLIRVPPASRALVRDTITVASRTLKEEQTIELVFVAPGDPGVEAPKMDENP
ncbi:MAG TPA: hypothetical protein VNQ76_16945 [Planctomicrobium sp.]|nr:hypothetical protein [Planctomicrobium sp.]